MKPTHGLVPYTGIMPIEICVDHTGPMTRSVADNALLLEVLAGPDGYDPRQYDVKTHPYTSMLEGGVKGMRIGVVTEGFQLPNAEARLTPKYARPPRIWPALAPKSRRSRFHCTWLARRYGCRSAWRV
jgi:amidase